MNINTILHQRGGVYSHHVDTQPVSDDGGLNT